MASGTDAPEGIPVRPKYFVQLVDIRERFLIQERVEIANGEQWSSALLSRVSEHLNRSRNDSTDVVTIDILRLLCSDLFVLGKRHQIEEVQGKLLPSTGDCVNGEKCL